MLDLLIIGQGLGGTSLARQAERRGLSFHLIDQPRPGAASRVAAGLINPVTGRNLSTTWLANELIPYAWKWYTTWEKETGKQVLHTRPIWRLFSKPKEVDRYHKHLEENNPYLAPVPWQVPPKGLIAPLGGAVIAPAGWLDTTSYLDHCRWVWQRQGHLTEAWITDPTDAKAIQQRYDARYVVWCEGFWGRQHPLFPNLPFAPTKGEILTVHIPALSEEQILIKGHFLVPLGQQLFRLGATYNWDQLDGHPTEEAKKILLQKLEQMVTLPYEVVDHQAGVRPTVIDRKPLLGPSQVEDNHWIFNGLGSKGSTLGPYWADKLLDAVYEDRPLPEIVYWNRKAKGHNQ